MKLSNEYGEVNQVDARAAILELVCPILQTSDAKQVTDYAEVLFGWVMAEKTEAKLGSNLVGPSKDYADGHREGFETAMRLIVQGTKWPTESQS